MNRVARRARRHAGPAPEVAVWLRGLGGTVPPLSKWPASVLIWLTHEHDPRTTGLLVGMYLLGQPDQTAPEDVAINAALNARVAILFELARRLGLVSDAQTSGGIFGDEFRLRPATGSAILEALNRHHLVLDGRRLPEGLFERICKLVQAGLREPVPG